MPAGLAHRLGLGSTAQCCEHQILVEDLAVVVAASGRERLRHPTRWVHADVVHRDIESAVPPNDACDHCIDGVVVSQVGDDGLRRSTCVGDLGDDRIGVVASDVVDDDVRSGLRKPSGDLASDPCPGSGDEGDLAAVVDRNHRGSVSAAITASTTSSAHARAVSSSTPPIG